VKDGEHYVINGKKMWCTNGNEASMIILLANTNPRAGLRGITPFIVEKGTPGFNPGHIENTMGIRGSHQAELNIENLRIHESQILGGTKNIGRGFLIAMKTLDGGRVASPARASASRRWRWSWRSSTPSSACSSASP